MRDGAAAEQIQPAWVPEPRPAVDATGLDAIDSEGFDPVDGQLAGHGHPDELDLIGLVRAHAELWERLARWPTDVDVAEHLGITVEHLHAVYVALGQGRGDLLEPRPSTGDAQSEPERADLLARLPHRERAVLAFVHEGLTRAQIAERLGLTHRRVAQLYGKAVIQLRAARTNHRLQGEQPVPVTPARSLAVVRVRSRRATAAVVAVVARARAGRGRSRRA